MCWGVLAGVDGACPRGASAGAVRQFPGPALAAAAAAAAAAGGTCGAPPPVATAPAESAV
eukprot:1142965-Pelagomonas_calceolata.AAC.5